MKKIMILIGPPGSGKSTLAKQFVDLGYVYINQDTQGKSGHLDLFKQALNNEYSIVVDRLNFSREQRKRYIPPSESGYIVECIVLHENRKTCLERMQLRGEHPTINNMQQAGSALNTFFKGYERPNLGEGFDSIDFRYPETRKDECVVVDIDNTIADGSHRQHFLQATPKNWKGFLSACDQDPPKSDVIDIILSTWVGLGERHDVVMCSGRGDEYREKTTKWLDLYFPIYNNLFMRERGDYKCDSLVKEQLLDFEIYTRYKKVKIWFDDRNRVIDKLRQRDILVFGVANGDF